MNEALKLILYVAGWLCGVVAFLCLIGAVNAAYQDEKKYAQERGRPYDFVRDCYMWRDWSEGGEKICRWMTAAGASAALAVLLWTLS